MTTLNFLIYSLAVWRVSSLITHETGPFHIFLKLRMLAGVEHDDNNVPWVIPDTFFGELLTCVWCMSIWVSAFFVVFWLVLSGASDVVAKLFAISAVAIIVENHLKK